MAEDASAPSADMIVASMRRASRAARAPDPSEVAQDYAWRAAGRCADALEMDGLVRARKQRPIAYQKQPTSGRTGHRDVRKASETLDSSTPSRPTAALSHVFSLQRPIDAGAREAGRQARRRAPDEPAARLGAAPAVLPPLSSSGGAVGRAHHCGTARAGRAVPQ